MTIEIEIKMSQSRVKSSSTLTMIKATEDVRGGDVCRWLLYPSTNTKLSNISLHLSGGVNGVCHGRYTIRYYFLPPLDRLLLEQCKS